MLALNDVMGFDSIGLFANKLTIPKFQPLARDPGKKRVAWATLCYSPLSARSGISLFSRCEAALRFLDRSSALKLSWCRLWSFRPLFVLGHDRLAELFHVPWTFLVVFAGEAMGLP